MIRTMALLLVWTLSSLSFASSEVEKLATIENMIQRNGIDAVISRLIEHEHSQLPIKKDDIDTVTSVMYVKSSKAKIYKHRLSPGWANMISDMAKISTENARKYMPDLMQQQSTNSVCSNKLNRIYLKHGVKIVNVYSEADDKEVFTTSVKLSDCGA